MTHQIEQVGAHVAIDDFREVDWNDLAEITRFVYRLQLTGLWDLELCERVVRTGLAIHPLEDVVVMAGGEWGL